MKVVTNKEYQIKEHVECLIGKMIEIDVRFDKFKII